MKRYIIERNHSGHGVENGPEEACTSRGEREGGVACTAVLAVEIETH